MDQPIEQASAIRQLWHGADDLHTTLLDLSPAIEHHAMEALAFLKAWARGDVPDLQELVAGFGRVDALLARAQAALDLERDALQAMGVQLAPPSGDPSVEQAARDLVVDELRREGVLLST